MEYFKGNIQRGLNGLHAIPPEDGVKTEDLWGRWGQRNTTGIATGLLCWHATGSTCTLFG